MRCLMCGRADDGETQEQKEARLKVCKRCRNVEAGAPAVRRTEAELAGLGQDKTMDLGRES